jgi:predicted dehydrogenase
MPAQSPRPVRTAIVGLGFGAEFIPIHQRHPHAELVAICQRSREKLDQIGAAYGVERRYTSYADLLHDRRRPYQLADP